MLEVYRFFSFALLLGGSAYFGYQGQIGEMSLAIVAGALALAFTFIDKIQRFSGAGFQAEMRQVEIVQAMVARETEPPKQLENAAEKVRASTSDPEAHLVLKALGSKKYTWRYFGGIAEDSGIPNKGVERALQSLIEKKLVTQMKGAKGNLWGLTEEGRALLHAIEYAEANPVITSATTP